MSESVRTSNLFAGSNWQKVFEAYQFISYTSYDFDTLKQALINYIQTYYSESFNDYIESSEFIAIIELIAYLGTSLAFRTDLNSRENFIDTAERRESIIRLAQMVNYIPSRNIASTGLFKISAVQTDQPLTDPNGVNLNDVTIFWNDPNNTDWFDQFIQICNASFNTLNPFGRPTQSGTIGSIPTDLYQLNSVTKLNVTYPISATINGQTYPIDICNPDFITNQTIFERDPDPNNAFNFIYRNDSLGVASANTGFFLYFTQGTLQNIDTNFSFPEPSRSFPIEIQNINQTDVYVQQTDQDGNVLAQWLPVPALAGENIIYNSIQFSQRNIFSVISGVNDTVTVQFADGNFGNVPTGLFRFWVRVSANQALVIQPTNIQGQTITIPYIGSDNQQYNLTVTFSLEQTIGNSSPSETNEQIKLRAPEVFSTQSRMVNGSDYNVLPLIYGNQIAKLQAINRTYSGMSRYIDLNDPTGFHRDLIIFGEDGALYRDDQNVLQEVIKDSSNSGNINVILVDTIQKILQNNNVSAFFYDSYIPQFEETIRVNPSLTQPTGRSLLDLVPTSTDASMPLYWKTSPLTFTNDTGYFANSTTITAPAAALTNTLDPNNILGGLYQPWSFLQSGAVVQFARNMSDTTTLNTVGIDNVIQSGLPAIVNPLNPYANIGPVQLSENEQNNYQAITVYPVFRNTLNATEIAAVTTAIQYGVSFYMYYDLLSDEWGTSIAATSGISNQSAQPFVYPLPEVISGQEQIYSNWNIYPNSGLLYVNIANNNQLGITTYDITARGRVYVFESLKDVRFYWEPNEVIVDNATGQALQDNIEIMPFVNTNSTIDNNEPNITDPSLSFLNNQIVFNISGVYTQDDGYVDTTKVEVALIDTNGDGIPDNPSGFDDIVNPTDRIVFEYYTDAVSGYQSTQPWITNWSINLQDTVGQDLYVYFPVNPLNNTQLFSAPYIANMLIPPGDILDPGAITTPGFTYVYLDSANLIFINNISQLLFDPINPGTLSIANQVSAFFNNTSEFPWMSAIGVINSINNIISGMGYNAGTYTNVPLTGGSGTGATANITFANTLISGIIQSFGSITQGSGYISGTYTNVPLTGGTGTGATATVVVADNYARIYTYSLGTLTPGGSYLPNIYENVPLTGGTGTGATATINVNGAGSVGSVINNAAVVITNPGTGYTAGDILSATTQTGVFSTTGLGSGFSIELASLTSHSDYFGPITSGTLLWSGLNYLPGSYTNVPLVGGHGTGAQATIVVNGATNVSSVVITNNGNGYALGDVLSATPASLGVPVNNPGSGLQSGGFEWTVATIDPSQSTGNVISVGITTAGTGYTIGDILSTSNSNLGGGGSGFSIPVATVTDLSINSASVTMANYGVNYTQGDILTASNTNLGGSGSGFALTISSTVDTNTNFVTGKSAILTNYFFDLVFLIYAISLPGNGVYYTLSSGTTDNLIIYPTGQIITATLDTTHFDKNGKVFTQNTSVPLAQQLPLYFKWSHYSPIDQRVDPSATNIIDQIVITNSYYTAMTNWINSNGTLPTMPAPPTTEELRVQFQSLDQYKMISDNMIWNSGSFQLLFGPQAPAELQANFIVVASPTTTVSNNQIKTQVITAIGQYFDIRNWDFGETFFYTELASFIHQQLSTVISTVVIVPTNASSQFGDLFEITCGPTQLFMSCANVSNVTIVPNLTTNNLRI